MEVLWQVIFAVVVGCTFLSTLRIAVVGLGHSPTKPYARLISHDGWCATLILFLPELLGEFARREVSPLPWTAFSHAMALHGIADGIFELTTVLIVELWLFWIPAHSYCRNEPGPGKNVVVMARALNLATGLLLVTPENPVYKFIGLIPPADPLNIGL